MSSERRDLVRPFLHGESGGSPQGPRGRLGARQVVRSYVITGGRTTSNTVSLSFETMLSLTDSGRSRAPHLRFEQAKIAALVAVGSPSVAEVAARLSLPIGVANVLCGDLVAEGFLEAHQAAEKMSEDVSLITRLIHGVRKL